jgi:CubicO group peptidase (beta-lactamase class C family)
LGAWWDERLDGFAVCCLGRADEVAKPLGLDFYIGLPVSVDRNRVAHLHGLSRVETLLHLNTLPRRFVAALFNPRSLTARAVGTVEGLTGFECLNREEFRVVEIPAGNGIGTARSVAKAYGAVATGGSDLGVTATTLDALVRPAVPPTNGLRDKVLHVDTVFSLGFFKPFPKFTFGSADKAFGTFGAGGSFGFADPDTGIGFAYVMNRLGFHMWSDPRELALAKFFSMTSSGRGRKPNLHSKRQSDEQIGAPRDVARM